MNTQNNRNMPSCLPQAQDLSGLKETRELLDKDIERSWDKLHKAQKKGEDLKAMFTTIASLSEDFEVNAKRIYGMSLLFKVMVEQSIVQC